MSNVGSVWLGCRDFVVWKIWILKTVEPNSVQGNEKHKGLAPERGPVGPCSHFRRALGTCAHCRDTAGGISRCFSGCRALAPMRLHFPPCLLLALCFFSGRRYLDSGIELTGLCYNWDPTAGCPMRTKGCELFTSVSSTPHTADLGLNKYYQNVCMMTSFSYEQPLQMLIKMSAKTAQLPIA